MTREKPSFKLLDGIIISIILGIVIFSGVRIYGHRENRVHLTIEAPTGTWRYDLETDRRVEIPGPLGNTIIDIAGKKARIIDSPCPNKTCIAAPAISLKGEWNACLPNRIVIRIEGDNTDDGIDALVD